MKPLLALLLLISCEASGQKDLRGPDSTSYTLIKADNCMCQEPQYFFTMKTPKGDTVKLDMLVFLFGWLPEKIFGKQD